VGSDYGLCPEESSYGPSPEESRELTCDQQQSICRVILRGSLILKQIHNPMSDTTSMKMYTKVIRLAGSI
jgi:hypothetical protein